MASHKCLNNMTAVCQSSIEENLKKPLQKYCKKQLSHYRWWELSDRLRSGENNIRTFQSCVELLGISEDNIKSALHSLHHDAGVLMYFPTLNNLVITNPQFLFHSIAELITSLRGQMSDPDGTCTGQFSLDDIGSGSCTDDSLSSHQLVDIMEHINFIARIHGNCDKKEYFMPRVLPSASNEELNDFEKKNANSLFSSPLMIYYKCGFVPLDVFTALIANLVGRCTVMVMLY